MKTFNITKDLTAYCRSEKTRYGFRHLAELHYKGNEIADAKCCYYNRTWEAYEFQSVLEKLLDNVHYGLTPRQLSYAKKFVKNYTERNSLFDTIGAVASIGEILYTDKKAKNDFKKRILKAGLENQGLNIPDDFDELPEDTKEKRLNGVIDILKGGE